MSGPASIECEVRYGKCLCFDCYSYRCGPAPCHSNPNNCIGGIPPAQAGCSLAVGGENGPIVCKETRVLENQQLFAYTAKDLSGLPLAASLLAGYAPAKWLSSREMS